MVERVLLAVSAKLAAAEVLVVQCRAPLRQVALVVLEMPVDRGGAAVVLVLVVMVVLLGLKVRLTCCALVGFVVCIVLRTLVLEALTVI